MVEVLAANKLKFNGTISRMKDNRIIWIPKALHYAIEEFEGEQLVITIERTRDLK